MSLNAAATRDETGLTALAHDHLVQGVIGKLGRHIKYKYKQK